MKISSLKIKNTLGIESLQIDNPGNFVRISGRNGAGKTSVITAIRSLFERGARDELLSNDADRSETVLLLTDGEETHEVRRLITEKTNRTTVDSGDGKAWLKHISGAMRLNPVKLITGKPAERIAAVVKAFGIEKPKARIVETVQGLDATLRERVQHEVDAASDALTAIDGAHKIIYDERRVIGRSLEESKKLAASLEDAVGNTDPDAIGATLTVQRKRLTDLRAEVETAEREAEKVKTDGRVVADGIQHAGIIAINQATNEAVAKLTAMAERDKQELGEANTAAHNELNTQYEAAMTKLQEEVGPRGTEIQGSIAKLEAEHEQAIRNSAATKLRAEAQERTKALEVGHGELDKAVKEITGIQEEITSALPVTNLEVKDGELVIEGVPFPVLNTQRQIDVAVKIAENLPAELDLCLIDGFECFDSEQQAAFIERAKKSKLQFVVTTVSDEDLKVESL